MYKYISDFEIRRLASLSSSPDYRHVSLGIAIVDGIQKSCQQKYADINSSFVMFFNIVFFSRSVPSIELWRSRGFQAVRRV